MTFAKPGNENLRLLLLAGIVAAIEIVVLPLFTSDLLMQSAQWPTWAHLLAISVPRLLLIAVLVAVLGPYRNRAWLAGFAVLYAVFLFVRFRQSEVYVNWDDVVAASRATLPYLAGMVGLGIGLAVRRSRAIADPGTNPKP